jgi:polyisoprenoid-binding protein YceI
MARLPARISRRVAVFAIGGGLAVIVVLFLLVYFVVFPTSSPPRFKLTSGEIGSTTAAAATSAGVTASGTGTTGSAASSTSGGGLSGTWRVTSGSQAGYRVREKLAFLPAESDAVGRTSEVTGSATFSQAKGTLTISAASFDVNVITLKSDRSQRDEKIHEIGLESSRYPSATFVLSKPLAVSVSAIKGKVAHVSVTGSFNIHGTSKTETLPVELILTGSTFQAVGALTFPWSEFGMSAPSVGGFVTVTGKATMEFDLHLERS